MEYVRLGTTGLKVSRICLGTMTYGTSKWRDWVLEEKESRPFYKRAIELGVNFFDTADVYSSGVSEEVTGRALKDFARRDEVVVATKVFNRMGPDPNNAGLSRKHVMAAIDASLRRLGMDYVDLYQIHRWDSETPIEETLEALNDVVRSGKARYIGASSMYAWQLAKALSTSERRGWSAFVSMQDHYNLVYREEEREMIPLCVDKGLGIIPWSPLARGFLTGNRSKGGGGATTRSKSDDFAHTMYYQEDDFVVVDRVAEIAKATGKTMPQVALAWMLSKPFITAPIVGASKIPHLEEAVEALSLRLSPDQIKSLEEPYRPHRILGHG
ncbi:MAG TPA: aldo/keto reductase [Spirochaetia bacterium]|nr:aldo/keto reductase [Spirochaetia bacterium]